MKNKIKMSLAKFKNMNKNYIIIPALILLSGNLIFSITLSATKTNTHISSENSTTANLNNINYFSNANNMLAIKNAMENPKTAPDMFLKALDNLNNSTNFTMITSGELKAFGVQKVNIKRTYNGKTLISENVSTGIKSFASKLYYENNAVRSVKGSRIKNGTAVFNGAETNYTFDEYTEKYSLEPNVFLPYTINNITISNASDVVVDGNNNKTFTIDLHPTLSTTKLASNLKQLVGLGNLPKFKSVSVYAVIDSNFNFVSIQTHESLSIKLMGINKNATNTSNTFFDFNTKVS